MLMPPLPLIIDCDPGIDDALALLVAAAAPQLALRAVTCVAGNRPVAQTTPNARRVLDLAGATGVPVYAGCARPIAQPEPRSNLVHGEDGLGGVVLPLHGTIAEDHAVDVLLQALLAEPPGTLHVVALGPLTNLALAELRVPGVLQRAARLDIMGGAAFCPGNVTPHAEFNFHCDPLAAQIVLTSGATLRIFGLDVTTQAAMSEPWRASIAALPGDVAAATAAMLQSYADVDPLLHDVCPVAALIEPDLFAGPLCRVAVEWRDPASEGRLLAQVVDAAPAGERGIAQVITQVDTERLLALVRACVERLPRPEAAAAEHAPGPAAQVTVRADTANT
ncbi:nucleoside hydrolase [Aquabacterium sp.]|uniref:nucleoside hydrolase n=1 Tax=Aquabacterium sp. TaxID=1872578 RepID=UPI002B6E78CA|nr:nucleoside hydrolase [Aquabacterium sp.]HSW04072.1 nucleoside hydrolase [Aquabacterium sp.]